MTSALEDKISLFYVGIGGNVGESAMVFEQAIAELNLACGSVVCQSPLLVTPPLLHPEFPVYGQQDFLNGMLAVESDLAPEAFLDVLLAIEDKFGRVRRSEVLGWGPRTLDLDLIAVGSIVLETARLRVPHPELHKRDFVLEPLNAIAPNWVHPLLGKPTWKLLQELRDSRAVSTVDNE